MDMGRPRFLLLLAILVGLLSWVWATDEPAPTSPYGRFSEFLIGTIMVFIVGFIISSIVSSWRNK
jgi:hypothetical protein